MIRSEQIELKMRDGGKEMERVDTQAPGVIEFLRTGRRPEAPDHHRSDHERGVRSRQPVKTFTATQVLTRTDNDPIKGKPRPPALTSSKGMAAHFDPKTRQHDAAGAMGQLPL